MQITVTEYYLPHAKMTRKQKRMEGGGTDRRGKPLQSLDDYLDGTVEWVSVACDTLAGPPGGDSRFSVYGTKIRIPEIEKMFGKNLIDFRLVDTGGDFRGAGKVIRAKGAEPIDVCRRKKGLKPELEGLMTLNFV